MNYSVRIIGMVTNQFLINQKLDNAVHLFIYLINQL